jgi:hypothetical protein
MHSYAIYIMRMLFSMRISGDPVIRYLKGGKDAGAKAAANAKVRSTVESILADINARGRPTNGERCCFGAVAGFGALDADIVYANFKSMAEGAALAISSC